MNTRLSARAGADLQRFEMGGAQLGFALFILSRPCWMNDAEWRAIRKYAPRLRGGRLSVTSIRAGKAHKEAGILWSRDRCRRNRRWGSVRQNSFELRLTVSREARRKLDSLRSRGGEFVSLGEAVERLIHGSTELPEI